MYLWAAADAIVVAGEHERHLLNAAGGVPADRISLVARPTQESHEPEIIEDAGEAIASWSDLPSPDRATVQQQIRARAVSEQ